jgi:ATP-dependent protease ClpP protease subunit
MPNLPDLSGYEQWWREHVRQPETGSPDWFRIEAAKDDKKPRKASVWIYDRIGRSWFEDGTDAKSFAKKLAGLDVDEITLHINSPGGDAFDGVAIYNTLHDHQADVHVVVDGLAASAASYIAQAGETIKMNKAAQMMIHRASGICIGNAKDMSDFADVLGKLDSSIAGIYHSRAGGELDDWLAAMTGETWYTAAEAVEAGLADESVEDTPAEPKARASFDLRIFAYAGRDKAPPPRIRMRTSAGPSADPPTQEGAGMDPAKLREALGLKVDASDQEVDAALAAAGRGQAGGTPAPSKGGDPPDAPPETEPPRVPAAATATGRVRVVDSAVWDDMVERVGQVDGLIAERQREKRDRAISDAIAKGKFQQSEKDQYERMWDKAPEETESLLARLTPGRVPMGPTGYVGGDGDEAVEDAVFDPLFPPHMRLARGGR